MKEIQLTKGQTAFVDDEDFEWLNQWKWVADKARNTFYACRTDYTNGKKKIRMHRQILNLTNSEILVDHRDNNGLNNCKTNLRIATHSQNISNTNSYRKSFSKYKGVYKQTLSKKYVAQLRKNGILYHFGFFETEEDAAHEYDKHAKIYHGEYAKLNFKS